MTQDGCPPHLRCWWRARPAERAGASRQRTTVADDGLVRGHRLPSVTMMPAAVCHVRGDRAERVPGAVFEGRQPNPWPSGASHPHWMLVNKQILLVAPSARVEPRVSSRPGDWNGRAQVAARDLGAGK